MWAFIWMLCAEARARMLLAAARTLNEGNSILEIGAVLISEGVEALLVADFNDWSRGL